jgi:adenylate cyclase
VVVGKGLLGKRRTTMGAALLEETFLGEAAELTRDDVVAKADVPLERTRMLWRALGFPDSQPGEPSFTQADVEALRLAARLEADQFVGDGVADLLARVMGQSMNRLAETLMEMLTDVVAEDDELVKLAGEDPEKAVQEAVRRTDHLLPDLEWLLTYAWRRHLLAASQRALGGATTDLPDEPVAVGFCDIVGYTTLTRDMNSQDLAKLVESFEASASSIVVENGARVIKTLGDEVMFLVSDAAVAARIALELAEEFSSDAVRVPGVRVGLAWGPALMHGGDLFGPVVNLASRCTGIARPHTVACDREFAKRMEEHGEFTVAKLRTFRVRGYGHLTPYALRRSAK